MKMANLQQWDEKSAVALERAKKFINIGQYKGTNACQSFISLVCW